MHPIVGIDVGKTDLHVGFLPASPDGSHPKNWRTVVALSLKEPRWWVHLLELVADNAVVAAEPTGHHLLAPVASVLYAYKPGVDLWQVDGKQTQRTRETHVSDAKNDRLDAIALTLIARAIAAGQPPRNCRRYNYFTESDVQRLRMFVNQHRRLVKERTRTGNQLNILAHSLFPAFAGSSTWARAVQHGAVTPAQVKALAAAQPPPGDYADGRVRRWLLALADGLPDIDADPAIVAAILDLAQHQSLLEQQIAVVEANISAAIDTPPFAAVTRRWRTVPNASDLAIAALHVATYGRATEFTVDQFCAAVGTSPKTAISGSADKTTAPRKGYRPVRGALHLWAVGLLSDDAAPNPIRDYYQASDKRFLPACRNKLARVLWGVAVRDTDFHYRSRRSTAGEAGEYPPAASQEGG